MSSLSPKRILVTLATGKQGCGLVKALAAINASLPSDSPNKYAILAVTRSATSKKAQSLLSFRGVELLQGDLNDAKALFANAGGPVHGVFSVQQSIENPDKGIIGEERQGKELADAAKENGVKHFVYSGVDFGGLEDTGIPQFESKRRIEAHITELGIAATIIRPVAFMDSFLDYDSFKTKIFSTLMTRLTFSNASRRLQLVACSDIGHVAARAFEDFSTYVGKTVPVAGEEVTIQQLEATFKSIIGKDLPVTYWPLPALIKWAVAPLGKMLKFFDEPGFSVDISALRKDFPQIKTWEEFVRTELTQ